MFEKVTNILKKKKTFKKIEPIRDIRELTGTHVAVLATDGFEQSELFEPKAALEEAGAEVVIISIHPGKIRGWNNGQWGKSIDVQATIKDAWSMEFDYLLIPGGVMSPDKIRQDSEAVAFVMSFLNRKRPVAAICHGPQILIETGSIHGRTLTSWPSIKTDLENAGARWIDKEVVVDHHIITSRRPADLPAFNRVMIKEFIDNKVHPMLPNTEGYVVTL